MLHHFRNETCSSGDYWWKSVKWKIDSLLFLFLLNSFFPWTLDLSSSINWISKSIFWRMEREERVWSSFKSVFGSNLKEGSEMIKEDQMSLYWRLRRDCVTFTINPFFSLNKYKADTFFLFHFCFSISFHYFFIYNFHIITLKCQALNKAK